MVKEPVGPSWRGGGPAGSGRIGTHLGSETSGQAEKKKKIGSGRGMSGESSRVPSGTKRNARGWDSGDCLGGTDEGDKEKGRAMRARPKGGKQRREFVGRHISGNRGPSDVKRDSLQRDDGESV